MRIIQQICNKVSSTEIVSSKQFFAYGAIYQFVAALFSLVTLFFTGFDNFNSGLVICSVLTSVLFAIDLFSGIEAVKGCSIAVANMFSLGGLIISVVVSYFWFGEDIKKYQLIGLAVFFVSAYLLSSKDKKAKERLTARTIVMLILNFLANGFVMVIQKFFALKVEGANTPLFSLLSFVFCGIFMLVFFLFNCNKKISSHHCEDTELVPERKEEKVLTKKLVICALLLALALFLINIVVTEMGKTIPSIIIFPISSAISILVAVLVGYFVFKESLTCKKVVGIIVGMLSIIIIGI